MEARRNVQLHSHDFEWEDLARVCREQVERDSDDAETTGDDGNHHHQQQLAQVAKDKWEVFHQLNNGSLELLVERWCQYTI